MCVNKKGGIMMKKRYKITDLCCANCAAKMEHEIKKIPGVENAAVNFLTQKISIEAEDARFDEIVKEAVAICKKIEPDCEIIL